MARLRQLPQIYMRGSIANETMRYLPKEDQRRIDELTRQVAESPLLAGHRREFIMKLGQTIGGDYHDDVAAADEEFKIAIWRGLIYLLYHADYDFRCTGCLSTTYLTQRGKSKKMDRRYNICPNCNCVLIISAGDTDLIAGSVAKFALVQDKTLRAKVAPTHSSPVVALKGTPKVADPQAVLADGDQLVKFFGEFIWNWFRQHIRENTIAQHNPFQSNGKKALEVSGPADKIALEEIISLFSKVKQRYHYYAGDNPRHGYYRVESDMNAIDASVIKQLFLLSLKYSKYGISISVHETEVLVSEATTSALVSAAVVKPQIVSVQPAQDEDEDHPVSIYNSHHEGGHMQEDGIAKLESEELLTAIRDSLPDQAKQVFDIITQQGETWERFSLPGTTKPHETHIARFMGTKVVQVKKWMTDIRVQAIAHGLADM